MNVLEILVPIVTAVAIPAWASLHPRSQLFGPTMFRVESGCALTFDDGPNPAVTPKLLELLEKHHVPATFFVLGKYVEQYPALTREIATARHTIGNHTYGHPNLVFFSPEQITNELKRCEDAIGAATGKRTSMVRPPFGFRGPQFQQAARKVGIAKTIMWSVSGRDWTLQPGPRVARRIQRTKPGDIVLLHDGDHRIPNADRSHTLDALAYWLPRCQDAGLRFVKI